MQSGGYCITNCTFPHTTRELEPPTHHQRVEQAWHAAPHSAVVTMTVVTQRAGGAILALARALVPVLALAMSASGDG